MEPWGIKVSIRRGRGGVNARTCNVHNGPVATDRILLGELRYERVMLIFRVNPAALRSRLAPGWEPSAAPGGNLAVGFCNVLGSSFANGSSSWNPSLTYIVFNGIIADRRSGETVNMRYATFASDPCGLPMAGEPPRDPTVEEADISYGCRKTCRNGAVRIDVDCSAKIVPSGVIETALSYEPATAETREWQSRIVARDPRTDLTLENGEVQDLVVHRSEGVDRSSALHWRMAIPTFDDLFDGTEALEAVVAVPWSVRRVYSQGAMAQD